METTSIKQPGKRSSGRTYKDLLGAVLPEVNMSGLEEEKYFTDPAKPEFIMQKLQAAEAEVVAKPNYRFLLGNGSVRFPERNEFFVKPPAGLQTDNYIRKSLSQLVTELESKVDGGIEISEQKIEKKKEEYLKLYFDYLERYKAEKLEGELEEQLKNELARIKEELKKENEEKIAKLEENALSDYKKNNLSIDMEREIKDRLENLHAQLNDCKKEKEKAEIQEKIKEAQSDKYKKYLKNKLVEEKKQEIESVVEQLSRLNEKDLTEQAKSRMSPVIEVARDEILYRKGEKIAKEVAEKFKNELTSWYK